MTKTPLTDLLQKYLNVIEKVTLAKTLDTGFDTSNYTKAWTQAGADAEKFLGLDKFKEKYPTNAFDGNSFSLKSAPMKKLSTQLANALFYTDGTAGVRKKKVTLLHITQKQVGGANPIVPESISHSYKWLTPVQWAASFHGKLLQESSPIQVSHALGDFWRINQNSNAISITQTPKFSEDIFFTPEPAFNMEILIHSGNDSFPRQVMDAPGKIQNYAAVNYQEIVAQATNIVKDFVKDEENLFLLNELAGGGIQDLPTVIYDAIMIGIADAANTCIHKDTKDVVPLNRNRVGYQALKPTPNVLARLEEIVKIFKKENEVYLTPEIINSINQAITEVENFPQTYDPNFRAKLLQTVRVKKFDADKFTQTTATMLYFSLALVINQINKVYKTKLEQDSEANFYFGRLGWDERRDEELKERLINPSLVSSETPMVILRGTKNPGGNKDIVFAIEPFVINFSGKNKDPELLPLKQAGIVTMVHNNIAQKAQETGPAGNTVVTKEAYMRKFAEVQENTNSIINSLFGKSYWMEALKTCYDGEDNFKSGVFFVGLAPLFWDKAEGGKEIYISYNPEHTYSEFSIELPIYLVDNASDKPTELPNITYIERNAAAIYTRREVYQSELNDINIIPGQVTRLTDANNVGKLRAIDLNVDSDLVKQRSKQIISDPKNNFKPLSEVRELLLRDLYNDTKSNEQLLAEKCKTVLKTLFNTVESGFWAVGNDSLACYNPFEVGKRPRFETDNTNEQVAKEQRAIAISNLVEPEKKKK